MNVRDLLISALMFFCIGCGKHEDMPDRQGLGVYCVLTNANVQQLRIEDADGIVTNAEVELYSKGDLLGQFVFDASKGLYTLDYMPIEGKEYIIRLYNGGKVVEARTVMPYKVERKFKCNPVLIPLAYRESIFIDPEVGFMNQDNFYKLFDKYPSYMLEGNDKNIVYSYFKDGEEIVDLLFSTNTNAHSFNKVHDDSYIFKYMAVSSPGKISHESGRYVLDGMNWKEAKYSYHKSFVRILLENQEIYPYHLASYVAFEQSSPELFEQEVNYVLELIENAAQYECYDKDYEFWGPNFFIMPYSEGNVGADDAADKQVVMSVSEELDFYLMKCKNFEFDNLMDVRSDYTNIPGGNGLFGAAYVCEYDFSNYYDELRDKYFGIIGTLERMPPMTYPGYEYGKYW